MKYEIKSNNLVNILHDIEYHFYKEINGAWYDFEVRKYKNSYRVSMYRQYDKPLLIFKLNENMEIVDINDYIKEYFDLPKGKINIENWQCYFMI